MCVCAFHGPRGDGLACYTSRELAPPACARNTRTGFGACAQRTRKRSRESWAMDILKIDEQLIEIVSATHDRIEISDTNKSSDRTAFRVQANTHLTRKESAETLKKANSKIRRSRGQQKDAISHGKKRERARSLLLFWSISHEHG